MNKKRSAMIAAMVLISLPVYATETYRSAGLITWEKNFPESDSSGSPPPRKEDSNLFGFEAEYIPQNMGYGMDLMAGFRRDMEDRSLMDWQGQLFIRYHLFGGTSFLDPYLEGGIGNAGTVHLNDGGGLKMSIYPFVSTGMNLVFREGLYFGGRWSYRMDEWQVPGTNYDMAGTGRVQVSLIIGKSYSTGRCGDKHYHYE